MMDAGTVIVVAPSAAVIALALAAGGWCLQRAVLMLLQHDRDIAVIKARLGLVRDVG